MERANCAGMSSSLFFPPQGDKTLEQEARLICQGCEVFAQCEQYAKTSNNGRREQFGIWAGKNYEKKHRRPTLIWKVVDRKLGAA